MGLRPHPRAPLLKTIRRDPLRRKAVDAIEEQQVFLKRQKYDLLPIPQLCNAIRPWKIFIGMPYG
jgi:hypothetical protein